MTDMHCGFIALIGAPNAGKSTLLNRLVGAKVSIVTHKVQTTRTRVLGIAMHDAAQLIFVDTPGIFAPKRRLDRAMVQAAWQGAGDADVVALLVDAAAGVNEDVARIVAGLKEQNRRAILILNKIDLIAREKLLALTAELDAEGIFERVFMVSATKGDGVTDLLDFFAGQVPAGPYLFPEDEISDMPMRLLASEITREKAYLRLHQELPYALHVETESWEERDDGSVRIEQVLYVQRESQRSIVLGKGGQMIKNLGAESRRELEHLLERRVHLFLYVKVRENWQDDPERYRAIGLDFGG